MLVGALIVLIPHFAQSSPLHADEYAHLAQARDILETGKIRMRNPYLWNEPFHRRVESGFHVIIAGIALLPGVSLMASLITVKVIVIMATLFFVFLLTKSLFKSSVAGLFAGAFFLIIPSSQDLLGFHYLVPLNMGILLFIALLLFFHRYLLMRKTKDIIIQAVLFLAAMVVYPITNILFALVVVLTLLFAYPKKLKVFLTPLNLLIGALLILLFLVFSIVVFKTPLNLVQKLLLFSPLWTPIQARYSLVFALGVFGAVFFVIGMLYAGWKKQALLLVWLGLSVLGAYLYYAHSITFLIPFHRLYAYFLVLYAMLCGAGAYSLFLLLRKKAFRIFYTLAIAILVSIILYSQTMTVYALHLDPEVHSLEQFEQEYGKGHMIMADGISSLAIYPFSGNIAVGLVANNLGGGERELQTAFFFANCSRKEEILVETMSEYVMSDEPIDCGFLQPLYEQRVYLYAYEGREYMYSLRKTIRNTSGREKKLQDLALQWNMTMYGREALLWKAVYEIRSNKTEDALRTLHTYAEIYAPTARSYELLARVHAQQGNFEVALKEINQSLELFPTKSRRNMHEAILRGMNSNK